MTEENFCYRNISITESIFLFTGSDAGGDRAAAIYSLGGSAKLNGLDPEAYLRSVIEQIADYSIHKLDDLLPWHVAEQITKTEPLAAAAGLRLASKDGRGRTVTE